MTPIFNHHALRGLSSATLHHLRGIILQRLGTADLSECDRARLLAALADIHAALSRRAAPPIAAHSAPSP